MFRPSECALILGGIETLVGQKNEVLHGPFSVKHLARVVPVNFTGIWRKSPQCTVEFIFRNKESGIVFVPDVVTKAAKGRQFKEIYGTM